MIWVTTGNQNKKIASSMKEKNAFGIKHGSFVIAVSFGNLKNIFQHKPKT